jgi:hypothetical protein
MNIYSNDLEFLMHAEKTVIPITEEVARLEHRQISQLRQFSADEHGSALSDR